MFLGYLDVAMGHSNNTGRYALKRVGGRPGKVPCHDILEDEGESYLQVGSKHHHRDCRLLSFSESITIA